MCVGGGVYFFGVFGCGGKGLNVVVVVVQPTREPNPCSSSESRTRGRAHAGALEGDCDLRVRGPPEEVADLSWREGGMVTMCVCWRGHYCVGRREGGMVMIYI